MGIIYKVTNLKNNKVYIGQTKTTLKRRKTIHHYHTKINYDTCYFHNAIRQYGKESFKWEIIWEGNNNLLNEKEMFFVNLYKSNQSEFGYNLTVGGKSLGEGSNHYNYDSNIYTFYHKTGTIKTCTKYEMYNYLKCSPSNISDLVNNKIKQVKGWVIDKNNLNNTIFTNKLFDFAHSSGIEELQVTRRYMVNKYNLSEGNLSNLINKKYQSVKGWKIK